VFSKSISSLLMTDYLTGDKIGESCDHITVAARAPEETCEAGFELRFCHVLHTSIRQIKNKREAARAGPTRKSTETYGIILSDVVPTSIRPGKSKDEG
jgi:hypothetical protein